MVKYTKYGDGGITIFRGKEISKLDIHLEFLGSLKLLRAQLKLSIANLDSLHHNKISIALSRIVLIIDNIIADFCDLESSRLFKAEERQILEEEIEQLNKQIGNYQNRYQISCKNGAAFEILHAIALQCERIYYRLGEVHNFQAFLNVLSKYFLVLSQYFDYLSGI